MSATGIVSGGKILATPTSVPSLEGAQCCARRPDGSGASFSCHIVDFLTWAQWFESVGKVEGMWDMRAGVRT